MITQNRKGISAVIATIMLLMITVSLIGVFYVFSSTLATQTTSSGSAQASQLTAQLSMCMQVDNIIGNQIVLRNCGKGVIENKSLVVMMDDVVLSANTNTIQEGNSSVVNVSGLWQVPFGKHSLKISNGAAVALALVDVQPNPDGLAGSWNFDEGSEGKAYDNSGNGNAGTLVNMNTSGNATSGWTSGKFGNGLRFDGTNDYVDAGNGASLNIT
ncbi:MAG: archaellin/type IV pilin N-terminal domain-containing protein, partial [Candidatus Aenigmatarchaeota archaeon]